jgi:hypothetical protein
MTEKPVNTILSSPYRNKIGLLNGGEKGYKGVFSGGN